MLILNHDQVENCLPMDEAIAGMKDAFAAISSGAAVVPARGHLDVDSHAGTVLTMPSYIEAGDDSSLSIKVATVYQNNQRLQLPTVLATVLVLDSKTGMPTALMDGTALTAIRTAAASAAATDLLARKESRSLAIIGSGVLARTHLKAIREIRPIEEVRVYSRSRENCEALCREWNGEYEGLSVSIFNSAAEATDSADIVCTVTNSSTPVVSDETINNGTHLVAVGSHHPEAAEIPAETVARSRIFVDQLQPALMAGDLHQPIEKGLLNKADIIGEVGELIAGSVTGRTSGEEITFFKSVGNAAQDNVAAQIVLNNAIKKEIGTSVSL